MVTEDGKDTDMNENEKDRECILVADDVEFGRGILKMLLRRRYDVLEAADGHEAIQQIKENADRITCVLLDIKMPGMDGYGVMSYMRRADLMDRIPVIALTSISDPQGHIRCYESGAIDLIEKPYDENLLLYKIKWNIDRFRRLNAASHGRAEPASATARIGGDAAAAPIPATLPSRSPLSAVAAHCREAFGLQTDEEVANMTESFMRTFGECVERLRDEEPSPDFDVVRDVTHDMNGFAANSGAEDLADLVLVLNTCAKATNASATSAAIRRIFALYGAYCEAYQG